MPGKFSQWREWFSAKAQFCRMAIDEWPQTPLFLASSLEPVKSEAKGISLLPQFLLDPAGCETGPRHGEE
jgi:hypothetical protein